MAKVNTLKKLEALRNKILKDREKYRATIVICGGTGCQASRSGDVINAIKKELGNHGLTDRHGDCSLGRGGWARVD